MEYDAVIIGAGVAGLVAGLKLTCLGKKIMLIEKQPLPGGFATSFRRKDFVFESSLHCVDSLGAGGELRNFLEEYGIDKSIDFIELKDFSRLIYPEHDFVADFNCENFKNYLRNSFPQEDKNIDRLFCEFDKFYKQLDNFFNLKLPTFLKLIISPFFYPRVIKASRCTIERFISEYIEDLKLKGILTDIWRFMGLPPSKLAALYFLIVFRGYYYNSTAYVKGGFSQLFQAMIEKINQMGGQIRFNTKVKKIITDEKNSLKAVLTDREEEFRTKVVISNANAIDTLTILLDNAHLREEYQQKLSFLEKSISAFQVYLGLKIPAKDLGMNHLMFSINTTYNHDEDFRYCLDGDYERCSVELVDHSQIDPTAVAKGKGSLLIMTFDSYANWKDLKEEEYKKKKIEVADKLIARAEKYLPGLSSYIEVREVATPMTFQRYGSSPEGAIYGFAQDIKQSGMNRLSQKTRIKGLILAGAWTRPGAGVHGCFVSGIDAADLALKLLR